MTGTGAAIGPTVTIVTPCYNAAKTLRACVDSVTAQTYRPVEHLVVDGASTDGTIDVLRAMQAPPTWLSEQDDGQSDAINKGMARATGDVLTWLNADDTLEPDAVQVAVETLTGRCHERAVVYRDLRVRDPSGTTVWRPARQVTAEGLACGDFVPQPGSFFTREAWEAVGGLTTDLHLALDFDLWLRMHLADTEFHYLQGVGATFAVTEGSKTGSRTRSAFILEEADALERAGLKDAATIARGRAAYHQGVVRRSLDDRRERAGHSLESLRAARQRGTGLIGAVCAPAMWLQPQSRRHLLARLRSAR